MSIYINNVYRIKRSASQQEQMQKMIKAGIFEQYKDILMISAVVGYNEKRYVPIEKVAADGVLMSFFNQKDYDIIDLIAYSYKREQTIIKSDKKYEIFESFANGGFPILVNKLGILFEEEISKDEARKVQSKYYKMLLSGEFMPNINDMNDELFI